MSTFSCTSSLISLSHTPSAPGSLPQALCTCYFLCLECSSCRSLYGSHLFILTTQMLSLSKVGLPPYHLPPDHPSVAFKGSSVCPLLPISVVLSQTRPCHRFPFMLQNRHGFNASVSLCCHQSDIEAVHNLDTADFSHFISWGSL